METNSDSPPHIDPSSEEERKALYQELTDRGLSASEAAGTAWPDEPPTDSVKPPESFGAQGVASATERATEGAAGQYPPDPFSPNDPRPPHLRGSSEPGYAPLEETIDAEHPLQHHLDKLHNLIDQAENKLGAADSWIAREIRTILNMFGAERSK